MRVSRAIWMVVLPLAAAALAADAAQAQGKGKDEKHGGGTVVVQQGHEGPRKRPKKKVTVVDAVGVTRVVLREHGYDVVRIEQLGETQIIYYRRGNMGRGRGKGPIERMIIRPSPDRIIIERAPSAVLVQINVRLGY